MAIRTWNNYDIKTCTKWVKGVVKLRGQGQSVCPASNFITDKWIAKNIDETECRAEQPHLYL